MVTGRDKELRTLSGRLSKLQNAFDHLADRAEVVESELEITKNLVRKANAAISEFKVNEHKGCSYRMHVTLITFLLVNHRTT